MHQVYLNYAATSNHKFPETVNELCHYLKENNSLTSKRGFQDVNELTTIFETRQILADFFNVADPAHIIFTPNATTSLNMVLHGLLKSGDHVVTTSLEHNAVARPLALLTEKKQISVTYLSCQKDGMMSPEQVASAILPETKVLVMTHASNVLGTILPVKECFKIAKDHGLITVLDSAQTAGFLPIDLKAMFIDILVFTGHKSLMGISGIGGFALAENVEKKIDPWLSGGTGSFSHSVYQPSFLPDKFEPGTANTLGILSLKSAVQTITEIGLSRIITHERAMLAQFLTGLEMIADKISILGTKDVAQSVPVVSMVIKKRDSGEIAQQLYEEYQIVTRAGLHCAPLAHQTAGTIKTGAVRFSFGWQTTPEEIDYTVTALKEILLS